MDAVDALFAGAPQAAPAPQQDPHAAVDSLFANAPAQKSSTYPLTLGGAALGAGELATTGVANMFPAIGNAVTDISRFLKGQPQQQTYSYFKPGEAGQNLLSHAARLPTGLHDAQNGQSLDLGTVLSRAGAHNMFLAPQTVQNRPLIANAVQGAQRLGGDLATLLPIGQAGKDVTEGVAASRALTAAAKPPTKDLLAQAASDAYKRAEESGLVVKPESFNGFQQGLAADLQKEGFHPKLHPNTAAALESISSAEGPQSLQQMEILRRITKAAQGAQTPDDRRLAGHIVDSLDHYVENLKPEDVSAGDTQGVQALTDARSLWSRKRKADVIDDLMERAQLSAPNFSGSGLENAIRTEFRGLAKNQKRMRTFTPEEQDAIRKVATGGPIENSLRMLGKFTPKGPVAAASAAYVGNLLGGPIGSALFAGGGMGARYAATKMTLRNAERAGELMRRGPLSQPEIMQRYGLRLPRITQ